jgi:hypothetical protein
MAAGQDGFRNASSKQVCGLLIRHLLHFQPFTRGATVIAEHAEVLRLTKCRVSNFVQFQKLARR